MPMSPKEKAAHDLIRKTLLEAGHKTYAEYFMLFELHLFDNAEMGGTPDQPVIAFMLPDKGIIYLNKDIDDLDSVEFLMRHEMIHEYLKHHPRLKDYLRKKQNLPDDEEPEISAEMQQLGNLAADWDQSRWYSKEKDFLTAKNIRFGDRFFSGLVLELDHPEWLELTYEELLDKIIEAKDEIKQQIGEQPNLDTPSEQNQRTTELRRKADQLRREAEKIRREAQQQASQEQDQLDDGEGQPGGDQGGRSQPGGNQDQVKSAEELEKRARELEEKAKRLIDGTEQLGDEIDDRDPAFSESDAERQDREKRLQRIEGFFKDLERERNFLDETRERILRDDGEAMARRKAHGDRQYARNLRKDISNLETMADFHLDLERAVKKQIGPEGAWQDTYTKPNRRFSGTGLIRPGKVQLTPKKNVPVFSVYCDESASFDDYKLKLAADAIHTIQQKYESKGKIKVNLFYHMSGGDVYADRSYQNMVGSNLVEHVRNTKPDNVIIITDRDPDGTCAVDYIARVKGVVFMLFPREDTSPVLAAHIVGSHNYYYDLMSSGIKR